MNTTATAPQHKPGRIQHFDVLKGIAIFMVVMGHVIKFTIGEVPEGNFTLGLISATHMPIFFMISGYFTFKTVGGRQFAAPNLPRRFMQLMVPFLCVVPLWVLYSAHSGLTALHVPGIPQIYWLLYKSGYWFLLCLMEVFVVYWLLSQVLGRLQHTWMQLAAIAATYLALFALSALMPRLGLGEVSDLLGLSLVPGHFMAFMIGVCCRRFASAVERFTARPWVMAAVVLAFGISLYSQIYGLGLPGNTLALAADLVMLPLLQFTLFTLAVGMVRPWCQREWAAGHQPGWVARSCKFMGVHSLEIYLLHYFFLFPMPSLRPVMQSAAWQFVPTVAVSAAISAGVVAACLLAELLIKRSRLAAFLLLGSPLGGGK